ncbi:MAG TPA: M55 family metallopeptidase [Acidimicrobiales bacterium]|nr:M55 family metallopeptidase [Acidimicrobiales bacterium]
MRVFLSSDMEGTAGIVDWSQCRPPGADYEMGRRLLLDEVNAAIDGAVEAGATEILVNDSHGAMANLPPGELHAEAGYLSGRHKPLYMMQGLDASFDAVFFVSYHGSMGSGGVLSHTYNPRAVAEARLNGVAVGEAGINALVALAHAVPVALVTGDQVTIEETAAVLPAAVGVGVKQAVSRFSASSLHPSVACGAIRAGAKAAVERTRRADVSLPPIELPARLEVDWLTADMAEMATWIGDVERTAPRTVEIRGDDPLGIFRRFLAAVAITRAIVEG